MGFVAYTFDTLMHFGRYEGIYFAAGYCGSGVGMASYLGMKLDLRCSANRKVPAPLEKSAFRAVPTTWAVLGFWGQP